ncbi:MAG: Gfo/Idh/MocA family oxidoreductase [Spirosomaceae bacterium]|jgi:predicted dehydrogenase|nr:Gfo/Idh/MocA family oxidoreductase [Spirosomataceae bacterium]
MKKIIYLFILLNLTNSYAQKIVRMGIVGMTHDHVNGILYHPKHEGMLLVGFAEPNKELAMKLLKNANLPDSLWFGSLEEMIAKAKPEAVCDFRSTYEHLETVEKCAPRKIHVMVEKPLAVNLEHAKKIESLATKHGINIITNYETTWYASHYQAFDMIAKGSLGELRKVIIYDGHSGPKEIGCSPQFLDWLTDPVKNGGGAIMDFGCYGADIMTWLMKGERPISVTAIAQTNKPSVYPKVDDEATIIVQYPKTQGIFQASWNWPFDRKDTEIYGTKGYIFADKSPMMRVRIGDRNAPAESKVEVTPLKSPNNDAFSYFAAVVRGDIQSENDLGSLKINMVAMEILDAAVKSSKSGKKIFLK